MMDVDQGSGKLPIPPPPPPPMLPRPMSNDERGIFLSKLIVHFSNIKFQALTHHICHK